MGEENNMKYTFEISVNAEERAIMEETDGSVLEFCLNAVGEKLDSAMLRASPPEPEPFKKEPKKKKPKPEPEKEEEPEGEEEGGEEEEEAKK